MKLLAIINLVLSTFWALIFTVHIIDARLERREKIIIVDLFFLLTFGLSILTSIELLKVL